MYIYPNKYILKIFCNNLYIVHKINTKKTLISFDLVSKSLTKANKVSKNF